jgi:N-methylhydantoinase A
MRIAVDIGGTFTDVLLYNDATGELGSAKVLSNPREPDEAFMEGIHRVMVDSGAGLQDVSLLVHGTTLVTNALLEKKTARVGLLVTAGFRDLLEIGRQQRPDLYDLMADRLPPLVPRQWVREIQERIGADGEIVLPLDERDARNQIQALKEAQIETLAVALLFSFSCPDHEVRLKELASDDFPEQFIFVSSQVSPEFREFERVSTTVVAAAVAPMVVSYLRSIQDRLTAQGGDWDNLIIMHSGGGTLPAQEMIKRPHTMIESGPAAGLIAAGQLAQASGVERAIAFDMGGTTAKAGLILSGQPQY